MRKLFAACLVVLLAFPASAAIKFFTDYANSTPLDSDFFVLQRNQTYINSSPAQVRTTWFNNPVFTGNGNINGSFTAVSFIGDGSLLTGISSSSTVTNVAQYFASLSTNYTDLVSNLLYQTVSGNFILANNGNGTNTTNWGVSTFQEIDAASFYPTNVFLQLTNDLLSTDGNGQITNAVIGSGLSFSGNVLSAVGTASTPYASNIISGGTITLDALDLTRATNFTLLVGANDTNNDNLHAGNNTNFTLLVGANDTNQSWLIGQNTTNNDANSTNFALLVGSNDTNQTWLIGQNSTNNDTVISVAGSNNIIVLSNNVLSEISGALVSATNKFSGDGSGLTNLTIRYTTNAIPTSGALTFGNAYFTNLQASVTLPAFTIGTAFYETCVIVATNSTGSDTTFTFPAGVKIALANGGGTTLTVTNKSRATIVIEHYGNLMTNAWANYF